MPPQCRAHKVGQKAPKRIARRQMRKLVREHHVLLFGSKCVSELVGQTDGWAEKPEGYRAVQTRGFQDPNLIRHAQPGSQSVNTLCQRGIGGQASASLKNRQHQPAKYRAPHDD
jgi:hypothetical protein